MNTENKCPICNSNNIEIWKDKKREYFNCKLCNSVTVNPIYFITADEQKVRYKLHKNTLEDKGYKLFLEKFAKTALDFYKAERDFSLLQNILDYGSGPEPALLKLLEEYKKKQLVPETVQIKGWDPYFNTEHTIKEQEADLVLCLEVAEHFEKPLEGFQGLSNACKNGGIVAVQTMITKDTQDEFSKWWYKEDSTHVTFYSIAGLKKCASKVGLEYNTSINSVHFFIKDT